MLGWGVQHGGREGQDRPQISLGTNLTFVLRLFISSRFSAVPSTAPFGVLSHYEQGQVCLLAGTRKEFPQHEKAFRALP